MNWLILILVLYLFWGLLRVLFFAKTSQIRGEKLPPGPRQLPIIGNLLNVSSLPHRSLAKLANIHGPIMTLKLGQITTVVVSSAPMARDILQTYDSVLSDRFVPDSLMTSFKHHEFGIGWIPVCPLWRNLRRICNAQLFAPKALDANQYIRQQKIQQFMAHIRKCCESGRSVDIREAGFTTSLNLLGSTIFSIDLAEPTSKFAKEFKELIWEIMVAAAKPNMADFFPVLKRFDPQGVRRRMEDYTKRMINIVDRIIFDRLKAREQHSYVRKNDMLDTLLDLSVDENEGMNTRLTEHLFMDLFTAGTDTTSSTLEWAMAELLRNPEKLSKVQEELEQVIGRGKPLGEDDIAHLPYLQAAVKETLRMHPPAPLLLPRKARETVQVGGYTIPEGAQILVNVWAICRDPASWKNPEEFIPERFLGPDAMDVKGQHFELLPFGGGRRTCPGLLLAVRMLHMTLGSLLSNFDWKLEEGMSPATMDMGEAVGLTVQKAHALRAVPLAITSTP